MSGTVTYPPSGPTIPAAILPAYVYQQYSDDDNIQALFSAYNTLAQQYLNWFRTANLPVYTGLTGALLDWVGAGLYGYPRPFIASGQVVGIGPLNTWAPNTIAINSFVSRGSIQNPAVSDDIYKRILTWYFFKGDGQQFCTMWLKRRIMRFLSCEDGIATNIDNTYPVSIAFNGSGQLTITITLETSYGIPLSVAQIFQAAIKSGVLAMPFQLTEVVVIINDLAPTGLVNVGGLLQVTDTTNWPSSPAGLPAGAVWNDGGAVAIVGPTSPNPFAAPVYYGLFTSAQLLASGAYDWPLTNPGVGSGQMWNDGGVGAIA